MEEEKPTWLNVPFDAGEGWVRVNLETDATLWVQKGKPLWIIYCTMPYNKADERPSLAIAGIVDNEIDAVRISEAHIQHYDEEHRQHMHMEAYHGDHFPLYADELDEFKNLYKPREMSNGNS